MGEILERDELPLRYTAFSTNFRREAGAAGRDTRGMFRVHQFNKVELFAYMLPGGVVGRARAAARRSRRRSCRSSAFPYRVVNIAAGELSAAAAKRYDIEAWFPSQQRYRELTSASNTTDYQARRLGIRYRANGAHRARAHAERHRRHRPLGARDPGELPGRGARRAAAVRRPRHDRPQLT